MKSVFAILLAVVLVISGLGSVAYAADPVNEVGVGFGTEWIYSAPEDIFTNGEVIGGKVWRVGMDNTPDETGAPVTNATLSLDSKLAFDGIMPCPTTMPPPTYVWSFGNVPEGSGTFTMVTFESSPHPFPVTFTPGFDASRSADKTVFTATDNQTLSITVTPRQDGHRRMFVAAHKNDLVNPVITSPTSSGRFRLSPDGHKLDVDLTGLELDTTWSFTVTIEVTPKVPKVEFMPHVNIKSVDFLASGTTSGSSVSYPAGDPDDEVGTWTWTADGSYEWNWEETLARCVNWQGYTNIPPVAVASIDPYLAPIGTEFTFDRSASYDPDGTIVSYEWDFGDGCSTISSEPTAYHSYDLPGLYNVTLTVTDDMGAQSTDSVMAVVYDPAAGFATGGGWFIPGGNTSYNDDFLPNIDGTSPANFGFVVKYKKGATNPDGQLEFQYRQGDFNLHSSGMEWLVITNKNWAKFQGLATIKGLDGLYPFQVDARDGDFGGRSQPDRFIIKVYPPGGDPDVDEPIYKASGDLKGGSIVIHGEGYEVTTLRLQSRFSSDSPMMTPLENFAQAVEEATEGSVRIQVYEFNSLVPGNELANAVKWGDVDMGLIYDGDLAEAFSLPVMYGGSLPFLYNDHDGLTAAVQAGIGDLLGDELSAHNITAIGGANFGMMQLFHKTKMLDESGDIADEKIRCIPGITSKTIDYWGGKSIRMTFPEVYEALEKNVIYGGIGPLHAYYRFKLYEVAPYLCIDNAFATLAVLGINSDVWSSLDEAQRQAMTDAAATYATEMLALIKQLDADALQWITDYGVNVYALTPEERSAWRATSQSVWDSWLAEVGDVGQQIIDIALDHNPLP